MKRHQLDLFRDLTAPGISERQTTADIESVAQDAAARAHQFHRMGEGAERRATDSAFCALILFGAVYVLEQRQARDRGGLRPNQEPESRNRQHLTRYDRPKRREASAEDRR